MDTLEDRLQQFGQVAAEAVDALMALMPSCQSVADDANAAVQLLQQYGKLVGSIGQFAWESGLDGLHTVCVLVETNLIQLQGEARPLTADECALLEGWPMLLFGYMANRADRESSAALLQSLSTTWPMPLAAELLEEELQRLTGQTVVPAVADLFDDAVQHIETQQVEREMIEALASELEQMSDEFNADLAATTRGTPEERQAALGDFRELMERLGLTLESVGLNALAELLAQLGRQLAALKEGLSEKQQALLQQLPGRLAIYLANPDNEQASAALAALLADVAWPTPIDQDALLLWQEALANVQLMEEEAPSTQRQRQTHANWEDVSLELPGDVNPELLEGLLQELPVQVGAFTGAIAHIAGGRGNMKDMERAMRAAHTLKGAANTVGVPGIANLTHHLEDILVALIAEEMLPPPALAAVLVNAGDCLEAMSEFLLGLGPAPEQPLQALQEVLDCANRIDREGVGAEVAPVAEPAWEMPEQPVAEAQPAEPSSAMPPPALEQLLRVPAPVLDELLRLAGETLISNSQIQEHLRQSVHQAEVIRKQQQLIQQLVGELEELVDIRGVTSPQQVTARKEDGFDALEFEHYSELHTVTRRLIEAATDAQEMAGTAEAQMSTLEDLLEEQHRLQMGSQHALMRTRMVAVSTVVSRLQRGVRQAGRLLDKQVELTIKGENTTIDSNVLNDLIEPLMHILRNAVDHGIEPPDERMAARKPPQGRIELSFAREGNSIVVRCSDDGAGLDYEAIRRFAERKGMLKPEHEHTEEELARLILAPGFSTREHASQVSGRGVGMDVVYSRVLEMKGMLALNSRRGQGLMVELRLPATLLSAHTLIVRQHKKLLAISSRGVEDIRYVSKEMISEIGSRQYYRQEDEVYGLVKLENLLSLPHDQRSRDKQGFPVLLTRLDDGSVSAVLVQEIIDSREVVMKKFGRYVPRTQGVIGAVILGDGSVAPVIDLVELQHVSMQSALNVLESESAPDMQQAAVHRAQRALVVDDSLSARRSLVQILKDAGFEVRTANDGMDAVSILEGYIPDIILTDMEMPRMNGLELTANVRHTERTRHIPIMMITSRSTEKHRQMSAAAGVNVHLIKPFSDDVLLQQVVRLTGR